MLRNAIKIAWRNFIKDRQFTVLNLVGLSTGIACSLIIYLWVADEWKVDHFHANDSRLFQVMVNSKNASGIQTIPQTPALLAQTIAQEIPDAESAVAVQGSFTGKFSLSAGDKHIKATGIYSGKDFFKMFSWKLLAGNKESVLNDKSAIVISKELAIKLFGSTDAAFGKNIEWSSGKVNKVSGIFEQATAGSSLQFDLVLPFELFLDANEYEKDWNNSDPATYVLLRKDGDSKVFGKKMESVVKTRNKNAGTFILQPFSSGYLYGKYENGVQSGGRIEYVRLFSLIAVFILIIACINFMNLSTAKASRRMKEVGIKKVVGASRKSLIFQYLAESTLMAFFSMLLAVVITIIVLPGFNNLTGKQLFLEFNSNIVIALFSITIITGLLSGSYPALYLSGFKPLSVLKGKVKNTAGELWIRKGLVVFQFTLAVVFIVSVVVVYRQIVYIQTKNQGFSKDNVISFNTENLYGNDLKSYISSIQTFLSEVKNIPGVVSASSMDHGSIIGDYGSTGDISWEGKTKADDVSFGNIGINYGLIETMGMQMAAGRSFSRAMSADSNEIIFNEAAIRAMGLKNPVGKKVKMWGVERTIAGVVKDFHFESMHELVKPFAFRLEPAFTDRIIAKIKAGNEANVLSRLRSLYQQYYPGFAIEYNFMDRDYQATYLAENRISVLSRYFTGLTILISCLGLFGLSAFMAEKRVKEIGIRKVLGATATSIVHLLFADFLKLILAAILIAFPLAWWITNQWLNSFAYHINVGVTVFVIAGIATLLITLLTISFQAMKAAFANPVKSLRSE